MAKFHVRNTFDIPDRKTFAMAGSIIEGKIQAGMFVCMPLNSAINLKARIQSIEFARRLAGVEDACLCLESNPEVDEILHQLDLSGETLEITTDGCD